MRDGSGKFQWPSCTANSSHRHAAGAYVCSKGSFNGLAVRPTLRMVSHLMILH